MDTKSNDDSGGSDSLDKSMQIKCVMVETEREQQQQQQKTEAATSAATADDSSIAIVNNSNSHVTSTSNTTCSAFETKVKLISQNLKETTLAEAEAEAEVDASAGVDTNSSNEESSSTTTISTSSASASESRLNKKVRFHPDVKENDGGNRVKKKKRRSNQAAPGGSEPTPTDDDTLTPASNNNNNLSCDGMDFDEYEEDDDEDEDTEAEDQNSNNEEKEEEFDLAKTIAEAEDYLKEHPLTFVRRVEQNGERLRDGLLNIEDIPKMMVDEEASVDDTDEDYYAHIKSENGIERILGKETKAGKVEFLLRYENQGGLFWESEEFIRRTCPTLLKAYEKNRERRQQRLMHHVAKRQSLRQRYTDF
ncbi:dentin sialophosphoprotein [Drosophila tropicalis]|uniref:dentin sialophosphoprotein n=1 Tax=Drosophila tropicalis TaxID=46794 RepID=UPI0035ABE959